MKKLSTYVVIGCLIIMGAFSVEGAIISGTEMKTGDNAKIWVFNTDTCTPVLSATHSVGAEPANNFNGNAIDSVNGRFYFSGFSGVVPSPLYFSDSGAVFEAGTLEGGAACGIFHKGKYYYVKDGTDDLIEVALDAGGYRVNEINVADITGNTKTFGFGDIAYGVDGVLYGYAKDAGAVNGIEFFMYDASAITPYTTFPQDTLIQLAFGSDGLLYGHNAVDGAFYLVDKTNGDITQICASYSPVIKLSDLAGYPVDVTPLEVPVDIKPLSCPNPLQGGGDSLLPVAILGTDEFDVALVDPSTVRIEGVPALRWSFGYGAKPYAPYTGKDTCDQCTRENDKYIDLVFKFDKRAVIAALGNVEYGECRALQLTGKLYDGRDIDGEDVVVLRHKTAKNK